MKEQTARRANLVIAVLSSVTLPLVLGQTPAPKAPPRASSAEQRTFSVEDESVKRPAPLPAAVARMLAKDPAVQEVLKNLDRSADQLPSSWFLVSEVHLSAAEEKDLLVIGQGPVLGGNVTSFWMFRPKQGDFELILKCVGHNVAIKDTRSEGYRDVEMTAATVDRLSRVLYKFNGSQYKAYPGGSTPVQ
jgi:hypothetical protein